MINTVEMREQRHKLLLDARATLDKADTEKRSISAEDRAAYDKIMSEVNELKTKIDDAETRNDLEREIDLQRMSQEEARNRKTGTTEKTASPRGSDAYRSAFSKFLTTRDYTSEEQRALTAGTGTQGGYLYASEKFMEELIQNVTDATVFRQLARVLPPIGSADSISAPNLTDRMSAAAKTSELGTPSTDSTLAFGKTMLTPHPLAKEVKVSRTLLKKASIGEPLVRSELARVSSEAQENGFMTGTGINGALGVFVASDYGISTGRDVSTGNTTSSPTFDGLKRAKYTLKQAYWGNAKWLWHRDTALLLALLKDGNGRYLLQDSVVQGEPDRVLGFPSYLSEFAPNTFTTGQYVGLLGDFREGYWIVDSEDIEIQRADELYIRTNESLFVMRSGYDGMPVKEEAFVRVKLG